MAQFIIFVVLGYLFGSISSAVIVSKSFGLPDPRHEGSKNPGATNVLRLAGKKFAAAVMVCDVLKGTIPVVIAQYFGAEPTTLSFTALAAVTGHIYPVFFGFEGGKGVATAIGSFLGLYFILGVVVAATWLLIARFFKYSSLASLVSMSFAPIYALALTGNINVFPPLLMITIMIVYKHRNNITRLMDGTEPKIKLKENVIAEVMGTSPVAPVHSHQPQETAVPKKVAAKKPVKKSTTTTPKAAKAAPAKKVSKPKAEPVKEVAKEVVKKPKTTKPKAKPKTKKEVE